MVHSKKKKIKLGPFGVHFLSIESPARRGGGGDAAVGASAGRGGRAAGRVGRGILAEGPPPDARGGAGALEAAAARPGARRVLRADAGVAGVARLGLTPHGAHRGRRGPLHQAPHDGTPSLF